MDAHTSSTSHLVHRCYSSIRQTWTIARKLAWVEINSHAVICAYLVAETSLALILAFGSTRPSSGTTFVKVRFGIFSIIRTIVTQTTVQIYAHAFVADYHKYHAMGIREYGTVHGQVLWSKGAGPVPVFLGRFLSIIPLRIVGSILFAAILYPISQLRAGFTHFLVFSLILCLQTLAGLAASVMFAAIFPWNVQLAGRSMHLFVSLNVLFAGTLIQPPRIHAGLRWMHYLAFTYFATTAYSHNEYAGRLLKGDKQSAPISGEQFLRERGLTDVGLWVAIGLLSVHILVYLLIGAISLSLFWYVLSQRTAKEAITTLTY